MRRSKRRNRATWFPVLGFENASGEVNGLSTVDIRTLESQSDGSANVTIIPIIPDIDIPVESGQGAAGGAPIRTLRDIVEGQTCIIERIVGSIQWEFPRINNIEIAQRVICCTAFAVVPTADDGSGDPALPAGELDPLRADNSAQPWLWRRVWVLGNSGVAGQANNGQASGLPTNNCFGSLAEGSKIDTKGTKRAVRREERIFMIHSVLDPFPGVGATAPSVNVYADLRVIGRMMKAQNRSNFK